MINLAGVDPCRSESVIALELDMAKIPRRFPLKKIHPEVFVCSYGELAGWRFQRAWYYWIASIAEGKGLPLELARKLYEHEVGKKDVRVGGHCGCPSPDRYGATYLDCDGKILCYAKEREQYEALVEKGLIDKSAFDGHAWTPDPATDYAYATVDLYHIDSQPGLNLFSEYLRRTSRGGE